MKLILLGIGCFLILMSVSSSLVYAQYMGNVGSEGQTGSYTLEEALEIQKRRIAEAQSSFLVILTDSQSYVPDEQIRLIGISTEKQRSAVNIQEFLPNGDKGESQSFISEIDGTFDIFLTAKEPSGIWTIRAKAGNDEAETTVLILTSLPKPIPILWTDYSSYEFGEIIQVNGDKFDNEQKVNLQIINNQNKTVLEDSFIPSLDGRFAKRYNSQNSGWETTGQYLVLVSSGEHNVESYFNFTGLDSICGKGTIWENGKCIAITTIKSSKSPSIGGGCLIATATYGSELASQVQQLRELRDNQLLQTQSGTSFMKSFNEFYYSFSPTIADWERESPVFKEAVKLTLTPMISSLSILNHVDMDSEESVLGYGISLILLNVGMYFVAPVVVINTIRKKF